MPDLLYTIPLWFNLATGAVMLVLGLAKVKPANPMALSLAITEGLLLIQLITTIVLVSQGQKAATDTVEFFVYVITALLIPPAAVFGLYWTGSRAGQRLLCRWRRFRSP